MTGLKNLIGDPQNNAQRSWLAYLVVKFSSKGNFYVSFVSTSLAYITIPKNKRKTKITWDKKLTTTHTHGKSTKTFKVSTNTLIFSPTVLKLTCCRYSCLLSVIFIYWSIYLFIFILFYFTFTGWGGAGLGRTQQGISDPISGGEVRDKFDKYKVRVRCCF